MAKYALVVETTLNNTSGAAGGSSAIQMLMPASRDARLVAVYCAQAYAAAGENAGRWVIDRCTAVATGSTLVPKKLNSGSEASDISDTTISISTTLACAPTVAAADAAIFEVPEGGWTWIPDDIEIKSGVNGGFVMRRATAPTGARVVVLAMIWEEM